MKNITYRDATSNDLPYILNIWRQFWSPQEYEKNLLKKIETEPELVYLAVMNEEVVGTIIGGFDGWWAWIYRVAVCKKHQNCGIGKHLFVEMHKRLKSRGAIAACIIASPHNDSMSQLIKTVGYKEKNDKRYSFVF